MSSVARDMAALSSEQRRQLEARLLKAGAAAARQVAIPRRATFDPAPLSFAQQRLWFLDQLEPNLPLYNTPAAFRLNGMLDLQALRKALDAIVARHTILRTTFAVVEGSPVQVIAPDRAAELSVIDLRSRPEAEREAAAQALLAEAGRRPFDLARDVMLRAALVRLAESEHCLLLVVHHIAFDGWSMEVLFRELGALYDACSTGRPSPLAELPIQYADYAVWQRQWLQGNVLKTQGDYWKQQLDGAPAVLELPSDRPRPARRSFSGAEEVLVLPGSLSDRLQALSRQEGATLFMTLLAAYATLLSQYSGQQDVVLGCPIAGRSRVEIEGLIGFFVNTLALRTDLAGNPTFRELVQRVRRGTLGAYAYQDLPFEKLVEELQPERSLDHSPLFQALFVMQDTPPAVLTLVGLKVCPLPLPNETSRFDLALSLTETAEGLQASVTYSTDLFDAATIERLLENYRVLLEGVAADPDCRLAELPLLGEAERHRLLVEWNNTEADFPADRCVHELFEEQVRRTPGAIALVFDGQCLTYRQLNQRANQLAHHLRALGVGPETLVAVCLERSLEMVVALLGILKAGGAYVPLDPAYPPERLAFLLQDAEPKVLLTRREQLRQLPAQRSNLVLLDDAPTIAACPDEDPVSGVAPENLAYVIYTSGSTGIPKGALVTHANVVRLFQATAPWFGFGPGDVWTLFHSYAFDFSVWEIWGALANGGRLVVVPAEVTRSPREFVELLRSEGVTVLNQTPSAFRLLLQTEDESGAGLGELSLRLVIFGGEALNLEMLRPWFDRHGDRRPQLVNMYGITETTVHVTYRPLRAADLDAARASPIGIPIPDLAVHLLDPHGQLVPVGVPGEIYVGGAGVGRGYLNRPELTRERYLPDRFSARPGDRLYRSGDLARRHPDGSLEYLGRIDHQVKLRGYRIELGEIEAALGQHPQVRQAVVLHREDHPGDQRLVAYVVPREGTAPQPGKLREYLRDKLPEYMVPSAFVVLPRLPLTPNGKLDRRALPAPEMSRAELADSCAAPRTPVEEVLAAVWAEVLGVERVGIHDNFFALGGHSLLATRAMSRVQQTFQVELPLRLLFEHPTVADLARSIDSALQARQGAAPPLRRAARGSNLPLSFAQQRLWFLDQWAPGSSLYNTHAVVRLRGALDVAALEKAVNELVRRHEALRTTFPAVHGQPVQVIAPTMTLPLPVVDFGQLADTERETAALRVAAGETQKPFDLAHGPLVRAGLLRLADEEHQLLLVIHHIIFDAWSLRILAGELAVLYDCCKRGEASPLDELPLQYADFAVWQRAWMQGDLFQRQLAYWKEHLRGAPSELALPTDHVRPALHPHRGASLSCTLPAAQAEAVRTLGRQEGATPFMTLLAAFAVLLHRSTGQDEVVIGSPIAGRNRPETEPMVGFFLNTLPLRFDLSGQPTFRELLKRVREAALGGYSHADLPFERLVEELQPPRDPGRTPLFQVLFVFQSDASPWQWPGLETELVRLPCTMAKFDLSLSASESDGGLSLMLEYSAELFEPATAERLLGHFRTLLKSAVAQPDQRVAHLPLLTGEEQHQLLVTWNDTAAPLAQACVHELFEAQAARTPNATAVALGDRQLSYADLNARANRLAHHLRQLGVGPDVLVGLCVERSLEMAIGLLGIFKAGGACVPFDPTYPRERLALMLEDTSAPVLLAQSQLVTKLQPFTLPSPPSEGQDGRVRGRPARVVCLDADIAQHSSDNPPRWVAPGDLAYVLYTSGSTGRPRGVAMEHRALANLIAWQLKNSALSAGARTLQFASLSFDVSFQEIFATWCSGGTLVLISEAQQHGAPALLRLIAEQDIARLFLPFVMLQQLAEVASEQETARTGPREIITAGEQLRITPALARWLGRLQGTTLHNHYGPTESHVATAFTLTGPPAGWPALPPIGRPIANTQVYVLDANRLPVPVGVSGELYIGGSGLARGYWKCPELTAERFIPNPFSETPGARLYRTGDLARWRSDGNLEFLGRNDHQVKLRGHRIELGEIESVLGQHADVAQVAATVREDMPGDQRLTAYIIGKPGVKPDPQALREFLRQKLPGPLVPSAFVFQEAFPLTPSGKIDRRALPAPSSDCSEPRESWVAPRSPIEEALARIWCELLGMDRIGIHDNFFALGGHSLLVTRVMSRVRQIFGVELPLRALFEAPTIAGLAVTVVQSLAASAAPAELATIWTEIEMHPADCRLRAADPCRAATGSAAGERTNDGQDCP